jgi:hypothetical protein
MYANQNALISLSPKRQYAIAGRANSPVNSRPDVKKPNPRVDAVMSPAAVPSANVAITVAQ